MPDGHPLRPEDPAELGGHRLLRRLGEGNQGVVYLGRSASGEHVAIKLLHARMAEDPGARERFVRELSAAKKVARFCTAQVLEADVAGDHPYIVSEYVEGRSLRSHILEEGPRTGGALERLAIGTLTALAAIHKAGIVHRDFTPHNVLLGPDGPRVIDFGIARALGAARNDETNSVGTPSYMAPEQVSGREIGPPADMFAWGSTILFAGTGRPPFGNESVHAVMDRIMESEADVSALPEPLRSVVAACLSKDPAERPTAQQAQAGLLGDEATEALMPPPTFGAATGPADPSAGNAPLDFHSPVTPTAAASPAPAKPPAGSPTPAKPPAGSPAPAKLPAASAASEASAFPASAKPGSAASAPPGPGGSAAQLPVAAAEGLGGKAPAAPARDTTRQPTADQPTANRPAGDAATGRTPAATPAARTPPGSELAPRTQGARLPAAPMVAGTPIAWPPAAEQPAATAPTSEPPTTKAPVAKAPAAERTAAEPLPPLAGPPAVYGQSGHDQGTHDQGGHSQGAHEQGGYGQGGYGQGGRGPAVSGPFAGVPASGGPAPRSGGSVLTPASGSGSVAVAGRRKPRLGWAVLAGAVVVVAGAAVAIPLWPDGGDAATAPKAHTAAIPTTPSPATSAPAAVTPTPQMNGIRSGVPRPSKHPKHPAKGCRDYQHVYTMVGSGTVLLHVSVCRDVYTGTAALGDTAAKDGWDVCVQLRGHLTGPGPVTYMSTTLTSKNGRVQSFENGPKVKLGAKTTRTEDTVTVNAGKCKGSGSRIQTSWVNQEQLAAG